MQMESLPFARTRFPREELDLAELYHQNTKYFPYQAQTADEILSSGPKYPSPVSFQYLPEGREGRIDLPDPRALPSEGVTVEDAIQNRRSRREFTGEPISLAQLSKLLHYTYGVTGSLGPDTPVRAPPSAGGRYPLELFPIVHNVEGLAKGAYHYRPETHSLEPVDVRDLDAKTTELLFHQRFIPNGAFTLLVGAAFQRTMMKYGERGYRLVLLDAGHAMENLYLMGSAMGLGVTGLGGFLDDELGRLVKLNCIDENVVYALSVGRLR